MHGLDEHKERCLKAHVGPLRAAIEKNEQAVGTLARHLEAPREEVESPARAGDAVAGLEADVAGFSEAVGRLRRLVGPAAAGLARRRG